ncbi:MAG: hypothetical protein M3R35_03175 [Candidatus Eremiobacteraeota bacterium]|nr:hypothetical protein [Candidatus Eremiobacteraeota bacterium]
MSARIGQRMQRFGAGIVALAMFGSVQMSARSGVPNAITYSDLTHETYTATQNLTASIAFPAAGSVSSTVATRVVVDTGIGAGVELSVNGAIVPLSRVGRHTASAKAGTAEFEYFGVVLQPGPNAIVATSIGANGVRGASTSETLFGPGAPARLFAEVRGNLVADGRSAVVLSVRGLDRWNDPALPGSPVRIALVRGDATFPGAPSPAPGATAAPSDIASPPSADRSRAGAVYLAQLGTDGTVNVPLLPGLTAGDLTVQVSSDDLSVTQNFYVAPYIRKPFVNGLISVGAGSLPIEVDGDGRDDGGGARRGRVALFATGRVGRRSLATLAYESQNALSPLSSFGPYVADPNERPYQTFGDSSTRAIGYQSNDRLYARLDSGRSSLMWGQFEGTTGADNAVGTFRELLSGAKADIARPDGRARLTAFTARNNVAYVSTTVPVTGLSTLARALEPDIVVGSDYLSLAAIDRRTGAVLSETPLVRNVDYTIDYATGVLRFINVPLPFDEHFNAQVLLIQYQYQGPGVKSQTTGGNAAFNFGPGGAGAKLQVGYVNDATGVSNFSLFSQTLSGSLSGGSWMLSHASSNGASPGFVGQANPGGTHGGALAFELNEHRGANQIDLQYQDTGSGYADPFGGIANPGFTNYRVAFARHTGSSDTFVLEADGQKNHGTGISDSQNNVAATWNKAVTKTLALQIGVVSHSQQNAPVVTGVQSAGPVSTLSTRAESSTNAQLQVGVDWKTTKRLGLRVRRDQTLSGNDAASTEPAQTTAELSYAFDNKGKLFVRELLSSAPTASFAAATGSLDVANLGTRSTQIGFERSLSPATTVDSEYLITNTGSATDVYSALGVQQKFRFSKLLGGNLLLQQANASGVGASGFTVYGGSLAYTDTKDFRAAIAYQTRSGVGGGSTLSGGFAGHLGQNFSMLGSIAQASGSGSRATDDRISIAYRPAQNERLVSLLGYQRLSGTSLLLADRTDVLSFEELYRPWSGFELAGRAATKLDGDGYYAAHTALFGLRARQNVGPRFDVGAEFRTLAAPNVPGARASDFAAEAGYAVGGSTRVAAGYNFSGSVDPTLTGHPQRRGFYLTLTSMVDRIFGWGAHP